MQLGVQPLQAKFGYKNPNQRHRATCIKVVFPDPAMPIVIITVGLLLELETILSDTSPVFSCDSMDLIQGLGDSGKGHCPFSGRPKARGYIRKYNSIDIYYN